MTKEIPLTRGYVAIVNDEDFPWLSKYRWLYSGDGYAVRYVSIEERKRRKQYPRESMHRQIVGTPDGMDTDHINLNKLDNRRSNLRVCTRSQNSSNKGKQKTRTTSRYKGVSWNARIGCWQVQIKQNQKSIYLGIFDSEEEAALTYNAAAISRYGEFARLNQL